MEAEVGEIETVTLDGAALTVMVAEADLLVSATLVAVSVHVPAVPGAVYRPLLLMLPPEALQVTAVLVVPVTLAVNCLVAPVCREADRGEIETTTGGGALVTVTVAESDFVESSTLVAVTVYVPAVAGAV
jgi:hypothetical protein